jgi:hypothetical protein
MELEEEIARLKKVIEEKDAILDQEKIIFIPNKAAFKSSSKCDEALIALDRARADILSWKKEFDDDASVCVVCLTEPKVMAAIPCGHMCLCEADSAKVMSKDRKCPICMIRITSCLKIYQ